MQMNPQELHLIRSVPDQTLHTLPQDRLFHVFVCCNSLIPTKYLRQKVKDGDEEPEVPLQYPRRTSSLGGWVRKFKNDYPNTLC